MVAERTKCGRVSTTACPLAVSLIRLLVLAVSCLLTANAFLIPEGNPRTFEQAEKIRVNVNSLSSYKTQLTYDYYSLPFCKSKDGVKRSASSNNPGTNLSGLRIYSSPYSFRFNEHETVKPVCEGGSAGPLTEQHAKDLKDKIDNQYRIRFVLDNMPITLYDLTQVESLTEVQPGFELGAVSGKDHVIFNHLAFNVIIHKTHGKRPSATPDVSLSDPTQEEETQWEIVGFEVMPCSIKRTAGEPLERVPCKPWGDKANPEPQVVAEGEDIVYTYDVYWQESKVDWANRWDWYTQHDSHIMRWYSTALLSLLGVLLLCAAVAAIVVLIVRRDAAKYEQLLATLQAAEQRLWSRLDAGVFQAPPTAANVAVYTATGAQLLCAAAAALALSAIGLLAPAHRGALLTALPALYFGLAAVGGFVSVALLRSAQHSTAGWKAVCVHTVTLFPCIAAVTYTVAAGAAWAAGSTLATPYAAAYLVVLWLIQGVPLTFFGGTLAARAPLLAWPGTADIGTTKAQPTAPPKTTALFTAAKRTALSLATVSLATAAGAPAFHLLMISLWHGVYFTAFTGLFSAAVITVLCVAACSVLCTYVQLRSGDGRWWWQAFRRGGAPALPLLAYASIIRIIFLPELHGAGLLLYGWYMFSLAMAVYLSLGSVGFAASFAFVSFAHARVAAADCADVDVDASDTNSAAPEEQKLLSEAAVSV